MVLRSPDWPKDPKLRVATLQSLIIKFPDFCRHFKWIFTQYRPSQQNSFLAYFVSRIIFAVTDHIFPDFSYFSLTTLKFPDFARFSRWVTTLKTETLILVLRSLYWYHEYFKGARCQRATSLFDLTFAEPSRWAKVRSKYLLKPQSEVISLSESLTCKSMV